MTDLERIAHAVEMHDFYARQADARSLVLATLWLRRARLFSRAMVLSRAR